MGKKANKEARLCIYCNYYYNPEEFPSGGNLVVFPSVLNETKPFMLVPLDTISFLGKRVFEEVLVCPKCHSMCDE